MTTFIPREESFTCDHCGKDVLPLGRGTYRDHCPMCLWSKHADKDGPGDRLSLCQGMLEPTTIDQDGKKGFVIVFECEKCGAVQRNKAAPDDELTKFMKN